MRHSESDERSPPPQRATAFVNAVCAQMLRMVAKKVVHVCNGASVWRQVFVKPLCGGTLVFSLKGDNTVQDLKEIINLKTNIPLDSTTSS